MKNIRQDKSSCLFCVLTGLFVAAFMSADMVFAAAPSTNKVFTLSENLDVDPSSGTASVSIPIEVSAGRAGIQPSISLLYNSSGSNGFLGVGWSMELGSIQRSTKKGIPQYNNTDVFILTQAGSQQELIDISGNGSEFRPEAEGAFMKMQFNGTTWILTDRKGTKYFFGSAAGSRSTDTDDSNRIFKWYLDRVEDINGNYMTVSYFAEDFRRYPLEIKYTGNTIINSLPYASVKFNYEAKTASADMSIGYISGYPTKQTQRLKSIETFVNNDLVRKYVVNYAADSITGKSLLKNVTLYGKDGVSTLPSTVMTYSQAVYTLDSSVNFTSLPGSLGNTHQRMMDMNNDGLADLVDTSVAPWKVYLNTSKNGIISFAGAISAVNSPVFRADNLNSRLIDLNADGLLDAIIGDGTVSYRVWINNGVNGFEVVKTITNVPSVTLDTNNVQFMDMNNDGVLDMVESFSSETQAYKIFINDKSGNFMPAITAINSPMRSFVNGNIRLADFNGDGLVDELFSNGPTCQIWLNNGVNGFNAPYSVRNFFRDAALSLRPDAQAADMNGDGLADMLFGASEYYVYYNNGRGDFNPPVLLTNTPAYPLSSTLAKLVDYNSDNLPDVVVGSVFYRVYINNGKDGFLPAINLVNYPTVTFDNANVVMLDVNGDGMLDVAWGESSYYKFWANSLDARQARANSLIDVDNSVGGHVEVQYQNLPIKGWGGMQYTNVNSRVLFNTVKNISRRATLTGDVYVSTYDYQGGLWDNKNREFRGFKTVKMIDPDGNYSVAEYAQDDIYKGKPLTQASYDSAGKLFSKSENIWANQMLYAGVNFSYLKQADSYIYDGDATGRRTQAQFFYEETPQYGNLTKSVNLGEVDLATGADIGTDKSITEVAYHNNTSAWLLGLPKVTTVKDNAGTIFAKTTFYYDGSLDNLVLPVKGYLTKKIDWAGDAPGTVHPFTSYTYDEIGNLLATSDSNNSTTSIVYDSAYKLFPLETTNALGHKVINEYYGVNGVALSGGDGTFGLWGQLKSTTDPNLQKGLRVYDTFGRTIKVVSPLDTIALPTTSYEYVYGVSQLKVITKQRIQSGASATIDTVQFTDGLGRMVQSKSKSEVFGKYIVSGMTEYNLRGLPVKKYASYLTSAPLTELDALDTTQPYTLITYDAMGRVLRTTAPDGSYSNVIYDDWNSTSYDENGHMQKSYADAFGRLIKKEEYLGADGRHAAYPASAYTLYATTLYAYDPKGNLISTQDAKGNVTTIVYDALGRKIQMTDPDMGTWKYGYDVEGNLIWQQDAKAQRINFTYDQINRLKSKTDLSVLTVNYTYDDVNAQNTKGRLTNASYGGGNTGFSYDALGRELQSIKAIGSANYAVNRTYDAVNRLVTLQYPESSKVGYTYNQMGAVNSVFAVLPTTVMPSPEGTEAVYMSSPFSQYRLNESASTVTLVDSGTSKTNVSASVSSATLSRAGKISNAISLNGTSQYVNMDAFLNKVRLDGKGSFSMWVKPQAGSTLLSFGGPGGYFSIEWSELNQSVWFGLSGSANAISATTPVGSVPFGNWTHLAFVQDGVSLKIYVNGQQQPLSYWAQNNKGAWFNYSWTGAINNGRLGAFNMTTNPASNSGFFRGSIDDLRYYSNKALIPQEVWGIYNNGAGTEAENPQVSNTPPPAVTMIPYMASPFAQFKLNDNAANTTVLDETIGYNDGVALQNTSMSSTSGKINSAMAFNGTSQYVDLSNLWADIRTDSIGTFSLWVKPVNGEAVLSFATYNGYFEIAWSKSLQTIVAIVSGSGTMYAASPPAGSTPANVYTHVAVSQNGSQLKIYINGVEQTLSVWASTNPGGWLNTVIPVTTYSRLGSMSTGPNNDFFTGSVDDLRYYKKALNLTEVQALYNGGLGTEEMNPALSSIPEPLPPLEPSTVPASAGQVYIKNVDYNAQGQMTKVEFGNGAVTTYTYSPTMLRLTNLKTVNAAGTILQNFSYIYDGVGNIMSITDTVNTATQTFKYDALNRLTQAVSASYGTKDYTYDQIGNIISKDGLTYTYSKVGAGPHAVTGLSDGTVITYDANGNMATKSKANEVMQYFYDKENRLTDVKKNTTLIAQYLYDGDGGRVQKTSYITTLNQTAGGLSYGSLLGTPQLTSTPVITKYVGEMYEESAGVGTRFIFLGGQRVAAVDTASGSALYYHGDHLGSTNVMTDSNGVQAELLEYDPYGKIQRHDGGNASSRLAKQQFTGKKLDDETGLIYFGARYYDPSLGRFITPDTIVQNPSDPQTLNRYSYCSNNPINKIDPDGHKWSWKKFWKAAIGVIVGAVLTFALGPAGLAWYGSTMAGIIGGAVGGAISGGLNGGWKGALIGGAIGGVLGGLGGKFFGGSDAGGGTQLAAVDLGTIHVVKDAGGSALGDAIGNIGGNTAAEILKGAVSSAVGGAVGSAIGAVGSAIETNILQPAYNTLTQPGYNYGQWMYGEKNLANFIGASMDSAWLLSGVGGAVEIGVGAFSGRTTTFYQYYGPKSNSASQWVTKTKYSLNVAMDKLAAPTEWTAMREVQVAWNKFVGGPRFVLRQFGKPGGGWEYKIGGFGDWGRYIRDAWKQIIYGYK